MPEYAPGTPSWVELSSPDPEASAAFYREVLGWSATEPGAAETGGYRMFQSDGKNVAGLMGHMQEGHPTDGPPTFPSPTPRRPRRRSRAPAAA